MTAIVGLVCKGGVWIGADRRVSDEGGNVTTVTTSKLFRLGDCLCGSAGDARTLNILRAIDVLPRTRRQSVEAYVQTTMEGVRCALHEFGALKTEHGQQSSSNSLVVAVAGRLFGTDPWFAHIEPTDGYYATGSGSDCALGALHALVGQGVPRSRAMVERSLDAAAHFRADVGGPFDLEFQPASPAPAKRKRR